ncbi:hypothetical protein LTR37_020633 [Vermiconidia calcicola]|uniref:Uncharacterized protein n=1 Tax=Vermiconidia calcicola TaxID=1690605 RepID=A0ACC3MAT9_9PEZI|nr:hypothetical protein LTR37_020633 [Vermiconidia calcicola]
MPRQRRDSTTSSRSMERDAPAGQEMASMYDYLAKVILLGPSGCGKSCLLHRFIKGEWRVLSSQTIGVEFASRIVKVGQQGRRKRVKLQLWDTAGTERFRSVSRSYYRGAAGAILVYDIANQGSFAQLQTFLNDARALGSPQLTVVLVGNKADLADSNAAEDLLEDEPSSLPSTTSTSTLGPSLGSQQRASTSSVGRAVAQSVAASWASQSRIPASIEVSALSGDNVDEVFNKLARTILTKIELGEIDPDDPMSGIQYGDADYYRYDDGSSIKSGLTSDACGSSRRRRRGGGWANVFKVGRPRSSGECC